jgi:hypothetical protein
MFSGGKKYIERIRCFLILILENLMLHRQVQKPANEWEWYICTELHDRLRSSSYAALHLGFMAIPRFRTSIFIPFCHGSDFMSP